MLGRDAFSARFPWDTLRSAWLGSPVAARRSELADPVDSADFHGEFPGLWLRGQDFGVSAAWLAGTRFAAAVASGLPREWIRVLPELPQTGQGREA